MIDLWYIIIIIYILLYSVDAHGVAHRYQCIFSVFSFTYGTLLLSTLNMNITIIIWGAGVSFMENRGI